MVAGKGSQPDGAERRLQELGIKLPTPSTPFGTYAETVQTGNLLFFSGMLRLLTTSRSILAGLGKNSMSRPAAMQPTSRP
jgi:hypothetical protein